MKKIILLVALFYLPNFSWAQEISGHSVLSLDTSKYLSANNEADKELEFRLFVQPVLEEPKRNIDLRTLQNRIRSQHKRKNR